MRVIYGGAELQRALTGGQRRFQTLFQHLADRGSPVQYLNAGVGEGALGVIASNVRALGQLLALPRSPDTIVLVDYAHRFHLLLFNWGVRLTGRGKLVSLANAFYFNYRSSAVKNLLDWVISLLFFLPVEKVFTSSQAAAQEVLRLKVPRHKVQVVYPALREEFCRAEGQPASASRGPAVLLFVGRLHPTKGLEYLLEALALLRGHDLRLKIVADLQPPWYRDRLFRRAGALGVAEKVEFLGRIEDVKVLIDLYRSADLVVLPSLWDSSPATLLEALCLGLPIVATRVAGIPEIVEDGVNGILVPPQDPHALARAISTLIQDPQLRARMGQRSLERSFPLRRRTWQDAGQEYYQAFAALLEGSEGGLSRPLGAFFKRSFDFLLALYSLDLSLPLSVLFALGVYLEDGRPIFFLQERCGRGGRPFQLIKFRTMKKLGPGQVHQDLDVDPAQDPRLTRVGRLLRATAMDELPSLLNILKGDMSFVGPRPLPYAVTNEEKARYRTIEEIPGYARRQTVRPGLTGAAQVYALKGTSRKDLFHYDNLYVRKRSFWLDLRLILISFYITFRGRWERRDKKL